MVVMVVVVVVEEEAEGKREQGERMTIAKPQRRKHSWQANAE